LERFEGQSVKGSKSEGMTVNNEKGRLFRVAHGFSLPSAANGRIELWEYSTTCTQNYRNAFRREVAN
jgi:hypothetical protein